MVSGLVGFVLTEPPLTCGAGQVGGGHGALVADTKLSHLAGFDRGTK